jgi:hypothetical protein
MNDLLSLFSVIYKVIRHLGGSELVQYIEVEAER